MSRSSLWQHDVARRRYPNLDLEIADDGLQAFCRGLLYPPISPKQVALVQVNAIRPTQQRVAAKEGACGHVYISAIRVGRVQTHVAVAGQDLIRENLLPVKAGEIAHRVV